MRWLIVAMLALAIPARGQGLLDVSQLPASARGLYADFLLSSTHRVFAMDKAGHAGWQSGEYDPLAKVQAGALQLCAEHGGTDCQPYAVDLSIVWPGSTWQPSPPAGPLADTINYGFYPDDRFLWRGPTGAAGILVWAHGSGGETNDPRGAQPPPLVRPFNNAGYDVVRYDRAWQVDNPIRAAGWLRDELPKLRASGYHRIIVAGESRGGWTALQILDTAGLADVVIALAPAAHGTGTLTTNLSGQVRDLQIMTEEAARGHARVAMVQFIDDPFSTDLDNRAALIAGLRTKEDAVLVIDRPSGFRGHFGWKSYAFEQRFGQCLFQFATAATPPTSCSP